MTDVRAPTALETLRNEIADALGDTWAVHRNVVESIDPPCYLMAWGQPWLDPMTSCNYTVRPAVVCIAGRLNAPDGMATLEAMIAEALGALRDLISVERVDGETPQDFAGLTYLTARIILRTAITLGT